MIHLTKILTSCVYIHINFYQPPPQRAYRFFRKGRDTKTATGKTLMKPRLNEPLLRKLFALFHSKIFKKSLQNIISYHCANKNGDCNNDLFSLLLILSSFPKKKTILYHMPRRDTINILSFFMKRKQNKPTIFLEQAIVSVFFLWLY